MIYSVNGDFFVMKTKYVEANCINTEEQSKRELAFKKNKKKTLMQVK